MVGVGNLLVTADPHGDALGSADTGCTLALSLEVTRGLRRGSARYREADRSVW
jgi:hypothetical protein